MRLVASYPVARYFAGVAWAEEAEGREKVRNDSTRDPCCSDFFAGENGRDGWDGMGWKEGDERREGGRQ